MSSEIYELIWSGPGRDGPLRAFWMLERTFFAPIRSAAAPIFFNGHWGRAAVRRLVGQFIRRMSDKPCREQVNQ